MVKSKKRQVERNGCREQVMKERELKSSVFKRWTRQTAKGGRECWMFRVKKRVGGSLGGRQQGYTVRREGGGEREKEHVYGGM